MFLVGCQNKSTIGTSPDPLSPREGLASETRRAAHEGGVHIYQPDHEEGVPMLHARKPSCRQKPPLVYLSLVSIFITSGVRDVTILAPVS